MPAMMAVSSISSLGTAYAQSAAYKAKGVYDQSIADTNAKIAGLEATQTIEAGDVAASRATLKTQGTVGTRRAIAGASGTDVNTGSNLLTRIGDDFAGRIDALTIKNNAARQAWGFKTQALQDTYQGQMARLTATSQSQQTLITGGLQAVEGPMNIYARSQYLQRWMGGGSGGGVPFDMSTATA